MDTNQLQLENEKLNARLDKAKEVFRQQAADIKAKDEAYLKLRDEYNELVKERDTHIEANAKLNNQILELEKQNQSISDMYNKTVTGLKIRENEVEELRKTIAIFEEGNSDYDELQEELNITKKGLHKANETISEYESKCKRYDEVIKSLNEKNDELEGLATSRLADINKSKEEIKKLNDTILEMNKNIETLDENYCKDYNALVLRYDDLHKEYNLLNDQFADLENEYNNSEELRKNYKEAVDKLNDEVARVQDIIVSKDSAYKNLESTYKDLAEEHLRDVRALDYKIKMLESELSDKTENLNKAYDEVGSLKNQLNTESSKVEEVKAKTEVAVTTIKKKLQALNDGLGDEFNIFG